MLFRRYIVFSLLIGVLLSCLGASPASGDVAIISSQEFFLEANPANELASALKQIYPEETFILVSEPKKAPKDAVRMQRIFLATKKSLVPSAPKELRTALNTPGSYVIVVDRVEKYRTTCIVGADLQGLWSGVYALLEKLGYGFYLGFETKPKPLNTPFSVEGWAMQDAPLTPHRIVFNWHNFLSGCSTWDIEQWQSWIVQSQKMGYNGFMVHAYGNNPMAGFQFKGLNKPVGYLSSTQVGRDWSTNHVNDVRRLYGGEVFNEPVFGSVAAINGTDKERTDAAVTLMKQVFAFGEARGMEAYFAVDIDTTMANPPELIERIPESGRFKAHFTKLAFGMPPGDYWLPNPDTEAGYAFYKAEVETLMNNYPGIDRLVAWHRHSAGSPWMALQPEQAPAAWQAAYKAECKKTPEIEEAEFAFNAFAQAKILRAFRRALDNIGRSDVQLAVGSWKLHTMRAWHRFMPPEVALMPLDYEVLHDASAFEVPEKMALVAEVAQTRDVMPIAWAHHDDGNYLGRPYTPYADFYTRLKTMECADSGFGIIHWTTKPLDLYFKSLSNQVWSDTKNEPLSTTCQAMATHCVGKANAKTFATYLEDWITTMPKIGRETSDFFIDHRLKKQGEAEAGYQRRMALLNAVDTQSLSSTGREWIAYFKGLEHYILDVYHTEALFNQAKDAQKAGDYDKARTAMRGCNPESVIEDFAQFSQQGGLTRGEAGLIVTMNTRWLPHYTRLRQQLGMDAVRFNFGATSHDPLAMSKGIFTFYFDEKKHLWQTLGEQETSCPVTQSDSTSEIGREGILLNDEFEFMITPIMPKDSRNRFYKSAVTLATGQYRLTLLLQNPDRDKKRINLQVEASAAKNKDLIMKDKIRLKKAVPDQTQLVTQEYDISLDTPGILEMTLTPVKGNVVLCGLVLKPVGK